MKTQKIPEDIEELNSICEIIRKLISAGDYESCTKIILSAMSKYPHAPQPHNLLGILLEKQGDHLAAMKHFQAASALDATYQPAQQNLSSFGTFFSYKKYAFDENDCPTKNRKDYEIKYDSCGIGHLTRRN